MRSASIVEADRFIHNRSNASEPTNVARDNILEEIAVKIFVAALRFVLKLPNMMLLHQVHRKPTASEPAKVAQPVVLDRILKCFGKLKKKAARQFEEFCRTFKPIDCDPVKVNCQTCRPEIECLGQEEWGTILTPIISIARPMSPSATAH